MIINEKIKIFCNSKSIEYYKNKGYKNINPFEELEICSKDLIPTSRNKIKIQCDKCGKEYVRTMLSRTNYYDKNNIDLCDECLLKLKSNDYFNDVSDYCLKNNYILLTKDDGLLNSKSIIKYICPHHGVQECNLKTVKKGSPCYKCSRKIALDKKSNTTLNKRQSALFEKALLQCSNKGYDLLSKKEDILNNTSYVKYFCPKHGEKYMRISNLINGRCCDDCANDRRSENFRNSIDKIIKNINLCGGELLNPNDYINLTSKNLKIRCPECGYVFITSYRNFIQHGGQVCDNCQTNESVGEKRIAKYLDENNIAYTKQKCFDDCRDIKPLPFDFYLQKYNTCIEFDGRQHFEETNYFSYSFEKIKKHDEIKNSYCISHNIKLIRIPYLKINNIEQILNNLHKDIV